MNIKAEWAAFVVAAIALVQPWVIFCWKKLFKKGTVEFHNTGKIEIGFSNLGPTIAVLGTYRAINGDMFVTGIESTVTRLKNKSQYEFGWVAFRSTILNVSNLAPTQLELPTGFLLRQDKPMPLHVVFGDKSTESEITVATKNQSKNFCEFENQHFHFIPNYRDVPDSRALTTPDQKREFKEAIRQQTWRTDCYSKVDRCYYWEPGEYILKMSLITSQSGNIFAKEYKFVISEEDSKALKLNVVKISEALIDGFIGEPDSPWKFIYCDYLK